jgi:hypothetical protein
MIVSLANCGNVWPSKLNVWRRSANIVIIHISRSAELNVNFLFFCSLFVMYNTKHIEINAWQLKKGNKWPNYKIKIFITVFVKHVYAEGSRKQRHTLLMLLVVLVHKMSDRRKRHRTSKDPGGLQYLLLVSLRSVIGRVFVSALVSCRAQQSK